MRRDGGPAQLAREAAPARRQPGGVVEAAGVFRPVVYAGGPAPPVPYALRPRSACTGSRSARQIVSRSDRRLAKLAHKPHGADEEPAVARGGGRFDGPVGGLCELVERVGQLAEAGEHALGGVERAVAGQSRRHRPAPDAGGARGAQSALGVLDHQAGLGR